MPAEPLSGVQQGTAGRGPYQGLVPTQEDQEGTIVWTQHWWPLRTLHMLDKARPMQQTVLGLDLVIWWSEPEQQWNVFQDVCPHRSAPLSQGRIKGGQLACAFHGWTFNPEGTCTRIPQMTAEAAAKACASRRMCATAFPILEENGVLYVWLDNSPKGVELSKVRGVAKAPLFGPDGKKPIYWSENNYPADFMHLMTNAADFAHADFVHAGLEGFKGHESALPIAYTTAPHVTVTRGFEYQHGAYTAGRADAVATRTFIPPHTFIGSYCQGPKGWVVFQLMAVPTKPGWAKHYLAVGLVPEAPELTIVRDTVSGETCKVSGKPPPFSAWVRSPGADKHMETHPALMKATHAKEAAAAAATVPRPALPPPSPSLNGTAQAGIGTGTPGTAAAASPAGNASARVKEVLDQNRTSLKPTSLIFKVLELIQSGKLPHWLVINHRFSDQDSAILHLAGANMVRFRRTDRDFVMPAVNADIGVAAMHWWLHMAKYPESAGVPGAQGQVRSLEELLDRGKRHVNECTQCQQGMRIVTRACAVASVAAAAAFSCAWGLLAACWVKACAWEVAAWPLVFSVLVVLMLARAALGLWEFREETFVSGVRSWRRRGGFSLVEMPDV